MKDVDRLAEARVAVERGDWQRALDLLDDAGPEALTPDALELRAQAAYGAGRFEAAVTAWEDLHTSLVAAGDGAAAARAAAMVAMYLMMDTGLMAPVRGWLRRTERLLEGHDETPAHAILAVVRAYERFMCGDMESARTEASRAIDLGTRVDVPSAVVIGRVATARVDIQEGRVDAGLDQLDEVGALLMSGAVDPLTTGIMYCELICAAQGLALHDRAREWTEVMERWRHGVAVGGVNGRCRVHRAEMLRISGPCEAAEEEALAACEELRPWMRREFGWPLVELGTIRLRRGDLAGAKEAFVAAHEHSWSPHPGLALLQLARGDVDAASALIADAIAHPMNIPSKERPPFGDLRLAPLLDAQAEIAAAAGDGETAQQAADSLEAISHSYPSPFLAASAALAHARAALLAGDLERAIDRATAAVTAWCDLDAPFEAARARIVLGEAHERAGSTEAARMERAAAHAAFDAFGAVGWAEHSARLLDGGATHQARARAEEPATATFRCEGDTRTISYAGVTVPMRDLKGFRYLERLLAEPGREVHVLDLVATENRTAGPGPVDGRTPDGLDHVSAGVGAGLPTIDDAAREAYRRRLAEIEEDIEEAEQANDLGRVELARADRDYLVAELSRSVGLGGRRRTVGGSSERARTSVTRSLRYAVGRLAEHHPALAAHLDQSVHTGTYCRYSPDPLSPVVWET